MASGRCIDANTAAAFVGGALSLAEASGVESHIDGCAHCRRQLSELVMAESRSRDRSRPPVRDGSPPAVGERVGRYIVEAPLGEGGMGVVFRARDPELGRPVALKMVRGVDENRGLQDRLFREAQAMARLAHPNVVTVYDLVVQDHRLFIAMELIEGSSLAKWLEAKKRPWREILQAFLQAGRGLGAAHGAGIVHRDFKPDNVLVDESKGRICVTDFGLARVESESLAASASAIDPHGPTLLAFKMSSVTQSGALMGTPKYMSPEQYRGDAVDASTDQFTFCVALYEALYGEGPFAGDTIESRSAAVLGGVVRPPPPKSAIPAWVRRALLRGMKLGSGERFPSMGALLEELSKDPRRVWRRLAAAALFVAAAVASLVVVRQVQARRLAAAACPGAAERLAGVWDASRKATIQKAFAEAGKADAPEAWRKTEPIVDDYARAWGSMYAEACGSAAPSSVELRRKACIEDRLLDIRALGDLLEKPDARVVSHAVEAARGLPPLARCNDPHQMGARPALPSDPALALRVIAVRQELARARMMRVAADFKGELRVGEHATEEAREIGYPPLLAEALAEYGDTMSLAESHAKADKILREAVATAETAGDDRTKAIALLSLYGVLRSEEKSDVTALVREQTIAAVNRVGGDDELELRLAVGIGSDFLNQGKPEEAEPQLRKALALSEKVYGVGARASAPAMIILAVSLGQQGKHEDALALHERAFPILAQGAGPEAPPMMYAHLAIALEQIELLRLPEAEDHLRAGLRLGEGKFGGDIVSYPIDALGRVLSERGKYAEAIPLHERALALHEKLLRRDHPDVVDSELGLGRAYVGLKQTTRAIAPLERAVKLEAPAKRFEQAEARFLLAQALSDLHRTPRRARELAQNARDTLRARGAGPKHDRDLARIEKFLADHPERR